MSHSVFTIYRKKDMALHRLHYMTSTYVGVYHVNQPYQQRNNADDHWIIELYVELCLELGPICC